MYAKHPISDPSRRPVDEFLQHDMTDHISTRMRIWLVLCSAATLVVAAAPLLLRLLLPLLLLLLLLPFLRSSFSITDLRSHWVTPAVASVAAVDL